MRRIFFILIFLGLLKVDSAFGSQASNLFLKQADEYYAQAEKETQTGNLDEAVKYLQKAVAINPRLTKAHYQLAQIYAARGWYDRAEQAYQKAGHYKVAQKMPSEPSGEKDALREARAWERELIGEKEKRELVYAKGVPLMKEPGSLEATYAETTQRDLYAAWKKGPALASKLDPYHPEHKDFKIPYYKDREGLKLTPIVGVRGEYMAEEQLVGIETLINEAQEFDQRTDEQAKKYISLNRKRYHQEEIILHYKENWPKFTYTYLEERTTREYDARQLWSTSKVFYDHYNRRYYQLEHTIPCIRKLGATRLKFRYGDVVRYKPNDPAAYVDAESYLLGIETFPYIAFMDKTIGAKFEYMYIDGNFSRWEETGGSNHSLKERNYFVEFDFYYPEKFLRIKPHFYYEKERHYPTYNTWWKRENGVKIEKDLNGRLRFVSDWTYIDYTRDKDPHLPTANHITTSAWKWENGLEYEFIRDVKLKLGADYGNGLGFDSFDYYTLRAELQWKKPGMNDFRIGYGHTNYFELDDTVHTFLFKLGLFI